MKVLDEAFHSVLNADGRCPTEQLTGLGWITNELANVKIPWRSLTNMNRRTALIYGDTRKFAQGRPIAGHQMKRRQKTFSKCGLYQRVQTRGAIIDMGKIEQAGSTVNAY